MKIQRNDEELLLVITYATKKEYRRGMGQKRTRAYMDTLIQWGLMDKPKVEDLTITLKFYEQKIYDHVLKGVHSVGG